MIRKRGISAILALCILLSIAGFGVHADAMAQETTVSTEATAVATEEITTVVVEETTISTQEPTVATGETTQELMPVMARGCTYYSTFHDLLDAYTIIDTGEANHTQLETGYSYIYTKSGLYWSIYLEGPNGPIDSFFYSINVGGSP